MILINVTKKFKERKLVEDKYALLNACALNFNTTLMLKDKKEGIKTNNLITKKVKYFLLFFYKLLFNVIQGYKVLQNSIIMYINWKFLAHCLTFCKYNSICKFNSLMDIIVVDNLCVQNRFELTYIFWNMNYTFKVGIKLHNNGYIPLLSIGKFYKSAVWLEREIWDMFGIKFIMHLGLRRILTDYGFKGYPLRKDYPLVGYVDIYYDDVTQLIKYNPLELTQNLRFFDVVNPWYKWYV